MRAVPLTPPRLARDEGGQAVLFAALVLGVLLCAIAVTYDVGSVVHRRISLQNAADAAVMSGAAWEAKGLNLIASLNQGIVTMFGIMVGYVVVTGISAYCCQALANELIKCMPDVLMTLYAIAGELAKLEKKVREITPYAAEAELLRIAGANSPRSLAIPFPFIPGDPHRGSANLGLHVRKGKLKEVVRKIIDVAISVIPQPVTDVLNREPLRSFVKEPFYKSIELTAGSFDVEESGGATFEATKIVVFERGKDGAGYEEFAAFLKNGGDGSAKVTRGSEVLVYDREEMGLDPASCAPISLGSDEVAMKRVMKTKVWGPAAPVTTDLNGGTTPKEDNYATRAVWTKKGPCAGKSYEKERWSFLRFRAEVTEKKRVSQESTDSPPIPLFVDEDFFPNQWIALLAWDVRESATAPLFGSFFAGGNVWGALAVAQARPASPTTGNGGLLWETDWSPRLMPVTAQKELGRLTGGNAGMVNLLETMVLH